MMPSPQKTHVPLPSQTPAPHDVPDCANDSDGVPLSHAAVSQGLPFVEGRSEPSGSSTALPLPSHCWTLQSPCTWSDVGVPAAMNVVAHVPLAHATVSHAVLVPQSAST